MIDFQPTLMSDRVQLVPLKEEDFDALYAAANDPLVWEMHPNPDRWQEPVFRRFFEGAMNSGGAFRIIDLLDNQVIGSTRFYDYNPDSNTILVGYTFFARAKWGQGYNMEVKKLMLDYALQFVEKVEFHIGHKNFRSQQSIVKTGAVKTGEIPVAYYGEEPKLNFVYQITKDNYLL
jgi:RimJ/RimL family protein N-acetyltransferase